jgi:hypothetical protein
LREERGQRTLGDPRRAVFHDDDGCRAVVEQGAHALGEQRAGMVIDDDGADGVRHYRLNTPW